MFEEIAERVKMLAKKHYSGNWTKFSTAVGMSTSTLHAVKTGKTNLGTETAIKICQATGVSLDWLLMGKETNPEVVDSDALAGVMLSVEMFVKEKRLPLKLQQHAKLISMLYNHSKLGLDIEKELETLIGLIGV